MNLDLHIRSGKQGARRLTGWQLVLAILVIGLVIVAMVLFAPIELAQAVVEPLIRIVEKAIATE